MFGRDLPRIVVGEEALAEFRQGLTGPYAFDLLDQALGRLLAQLVVGVGKSRWLVEIIKYNMGPDRRYDLIVALFPRWDILKEVEVQLPADLERVVLRPRPRRQCGALDEQWTNYERANCGLLGRKDLCGCCRRKRRCYWPEQYGKALRGVPVVLTTQHHLSLNPQFVHQLQRDAQADRPLVLLDESALLLKDTEWVIRLHDLERFIAATKHAGEDNGARVMAKWTDLTELLAMAPTEDLQGGQWRSPSISPAWAVSVQRAGREQFGDAFRFMGFDLQYFCWSDPASRERLTNGDLRFAVPPSLGKEFVIFSGSMAKELVRYRLDPNHRWGPVCSPFANTEFLHPGTQWFNISSMAGAARYFERNASSILDFFATKIAGNIRQGKRTLLIGKKRFVPLCNKHLSKKLEELGVQARIVTGNWDRADLDDPGTLPLINYGISGVNRFQDFDAAYCLTGYYANQVVLAKTVHDIDATADRFPISIRTTANPKGRHAHVELPDNRATILPHVAQWVLDQLEADVVVQAVGRIRPFTRPREVITFHAGRLPGVQYTMDFGSLPAARKYFRILTPRAARRHSRAEEARQLRQAQLSRAEIASRLNVHPTTVGRYLNHQNEARNL